MEKQDYNIKKIIEEGSKYKFKNIKYAVDMVIITIDERILLIQRKFYPLGYALPGGKVDSMETPEEAAWRELKEETGLDKKNYIKDIKLFKYLGRFDKEDRDPRGRMISNAYLAYLGKKSSNILVKGGDDTTQAKWVSKKNVKYLIAKNKKLTQAEKDEGLTKGKLKLEDILAFDHCDIIEKALTVLTSYKKELKIKV